MINKWCRPAFAVAALLATLAARAGPADDLKSLVERGKSKEAYELGAQHPELLGDPAFDFYFGVAAADAGHAGEGVLALERYLIRFPANLVARVELARAYFVLGEDARAREEFENSLKQDPPADVQLTIGRYLDAIRLREARYKNSSSFYIEAGLGWDTNVNGGVSNANINLPVLGNVTVAGTGVAKSDSFTYLATGGEGSHPVAPGVALFGAVGIEAKTNRVEHDFDLLSGTASGGVSFLSDKNLYKLSATQSTLEVQSDRFRTLSGVSGEWSHQIDELQSFQASAQGARFSYTGDNEPRNANYGGLGLGYRKAFVKNWQPVLSLGINGGDEHNIENRPDLGRKIAGARVALGISPGAKWGINVGVTYQYSHYDGPDVVLGEVRRDQYYAADAAVIYLYDRNLSFRMEVLASDNRSNLELYEYKRNLAVFKVRYEFK